MPHGDWSGDTRKSCLLHAGRAAEPSPRLRGKEQENKTVTSGDGRNEAARIRGPRLLQRGGVRPVDFAQELCRLVQVNLRAGPDDRKDPRCGLSLLPAPKRHSRAMHR